MPIFSIDHVRSWKHDVWGSGHRMGGHHFKSLFTLSPSHIELLVASPLSLTRAHSHFFSSPQLPVTLGWGPCSAYMLWLDTSWVPDLTYIFRPHSPLFNVIFSTWTSFHHYFSISHITTCDIRSLSFLSSLLTRHYLGFTWGAGFSHVTAWRLVTFLPRSPYEQWFRDLILRGCIVSEDSCYISTWGVFIHLAMYFIGDYSLLIRVCAK